MATHKMESVFCFGERGWLGWQGDVEKKEGHVGVWSNLWFKHPHLTRDLLAKHSIIVTGGS